MFGVTGTVVIGRTLAYETLMRWTPDYSKVIPNVARSVQVADHGRRYTFQLRSGMRWSDGEPFTSDDLVYAVNDVLLNSDLYPSPPSWLLSEDKPGRVSAPDKHTVEFRFAEPNGLFLLTLATLHTQALTRQPKHYLKQFHTKYANDIERTVEDAGFDDWTKLYQAKSDNLTNPDTPTLFGWLPTAPLKGNKIGFERNPYYWKVDPDRRQLPYIDNFTFDIVDATEVIVLKATHGDIDLSTLYVNTLDNKPVLARNRKEGGYHFGKLRPGHMNVMMLALNLCHKDEGLRKLFQTRDFRIGLSHAINRPEIIKTVLQRQGVPWQGAPRKDSRYYDELLAKQYTDHDPRKADDYLTRAGLTQRDSDGYRIDGDGKRVRISVEAPSMTAEYVPILELVRRYWKAVGIDMRIKNEERSLFYERKEANLHDAAVYSGEYGLTHGALLDPRWYMPFSSESNYAIQWAAWYNSNGREGQEPPSPAQEQMRIYDEIRQTIDEDQRDKLFKKILGIAREQFWVMGIACPNQGYQVVADRLHNVPDAIPNSYTYPFPAPTNLEQYYLEPGT